MPVQLANILTGFDWMSPPEFAALQMYHAVWWHLAEVSVKLSMSVKIPELTTLPVLGSLIDMFVDVELFTMHDRRIFGDSFNVCIWSARKIVMVGNSETINMTSVINFKYDSSRERLNNSCNIENLYEQDSPYIELYIWKKNKLTIKCKIDSFFLTDINCINLAHIRPCIFKSI